MAPTSARGGRHWIVGGMAVLALGGFLAAVATAWMSTEPLFGVALAVVAFCLIGGGVGAAGTSLLVLLAQADRRQPPRGCGDHRLGDDDRRLHRDDGRRRPSARSVLADPPGDRLRIGLGGGDDPHLVGVWGVEQAKPAAHARCRRRPSTSRRSAKRSPRSGPNRRRGGLRSSSLSRCWPTARRI